MSGREDRNPPEDGDDGRKSDRDDTGESGLVRVIMIVCWMMSRLCCRR